MEPRQGVGGNANGMGSFPLLRWPGTLLLQQVQSEILWFIYQMLQVSSLSSIKMTHSVSLVPCLPFPWGHCCQDSRLAGPVVPTHQKG